MTKHKLIISKQFADEIKCHRYWCRDCAATFHFKDLSSIGMMLGLHETSDGEFHPVIKLHSYK